MLKMWCKKIFVNILYMPQKIKIKRLFVILGVEKWEQFFKNIIDHN